MFGIIIFLYFLLVSIIGWIMEVFVCSLEKRKFVDRGFLIGPYCPIYGFGALILLSLSYFKNNLIIVFLLSTILCSILEYFVSYYMEKIFKIRWWDYSCEPFNIHGRICLRNALAFGILGVVLVCFINSYIFRILINISNEVLIILFLILFLILLIDIIFSVRIMINIKYSVVNLESKNIFKDATNDIKLLIRNNLLSKSLLYKRFIKAYEDFECYLGDIKEKINISNSNLKKRKLLLIIFPIIGFLLGILLLILFEEFRYGFMLGFGMFVILGFLFDRIRKK